jgi:DNA-binding NarL/FixJ family response regulator
MIGTQRASGIQLNPALTGEETIVLRALAGGNTDRQVCKQLRIHPDTYLRMMCDMREKIHMADNVSLIEWAKERIQGIDQRIDQANGQPRLA